MKKQTQELIGNLISWLTNKRKRNSIARIKMFFFFFIKKKRIYEECPVSKHSFLLIKNTVPWFLLCSCIIISLIQCLITDSTKVDLCCFFCFMQQLSFKTTVWIIEYVRVRFVSLSIFWKKGMLSKTHCQIVKIYWENAVSDRMAQKCFR